MTQDRPEADFQTEVANLARLHEVFWKLRFPKLGRRVDGFHELDYTIGGFSDPRLTWVGVLSPENFPLITEEEEAAVRQAIARSDNKTEAHDLEVYFNKMKELEAQLLRVVIADHERLKGGRESCGTDEPPPRTRDGNDR